MFWRSVVFKLWFTILLLVSFVLLILTILLLEFFQNYNADQAEQNLMQTATKVSVMVDHYDDRGLIYETTKRVKDPSSKIALVFGEGDFWISDQKDDSLPNISYDWLMSEKDLSSVISNDEEVKKQVILPGTENKVIIVGTKLPNQNGAVYVYQSLNVLKETSRHTTRIIWLAAGVALILTTIFAFFLSSRITSPLIKMREGAFELAKGEFNTKVPILTHDEIGELAMAFNRMGRQLKFHINALRQEKEQVSSILSSMADGVLTLNRKGNIMVSNPPAEKFLEDWHFENDSAEEEVNLPTELMETLDEVVATEKEVMREISIQGRNWAMIMTPLYDQSYVRGAVAVFRDVTDERRLDKLREDFIANVSHELRTPISLLQGYSEAIVDNIAESKEEKNELAGIIHEESLRIGRLVNELLDLARMESGHIQLEMELVDMEPFLDRIVKKFSGMAHDKAVSLSLENNLQITKLTFDSDKIEQVFTNLIDNAIKHSFSGGKVRIILSEEEKEVVCSVMDEGAGIPADDLPFVFERFYKADKSRKRENSKTGTGLGLAIAKNIMEAHQGSLTVQSKVEEGTTFTFRIPKNIE
ncbi:ATP-binding protein [Sediminibacillus halophilus]|uniref:histidine kinase n=1 Tax=Sediminibacillus halophilus TaxID=482461 RepID=A0A1G9LTS1_9BACI|nr:ATP-binding protein [Sediminibacillus halophilus]SDL65131.1 two-component system, OmpR family, sensor histidine kinase ResE [Sediminibacillus halophilus]